ncbi:UNVERIFIED_CONTAM: hypothetical protein Scaly_2869300 [Sesamum calycinum]|uniref:Transposase n=1 Tax=Sesamum calycinum TaxID=2727403 RepID=A0AAW2LDZ0_9LAMI
MCHPSDAKAWKYFDWMYPNFTEESCNVRLGLCTDSFAPHDYGRTYSCWLVIITPYDLPPGMCMSFEYMILTIVIPDPSNPKRLIDVYLEPLIEELLQLWHVGVRTYDHATSGFHHAGRVDVDCERPTSLWNGVWVEYRRGYGMSGDQILDRVANISPAVEMLLSLPDGYGSDHKWTKKSICWDLPYWPTHLIRHNLDVMHIEKNVFDNIFNTVMDIKEKIKDNMNAHRDLKIICNRPELELNEHRPNVMPKATERHNTVKSTMNYGVCVKSSSYTDEENGFYGIIENIIQLTYPLIPNLHIVLFKCHWVDPVQGMKAAGTSRRGLHENDDENEDEDEDSGGDNETDDEEYEAT